MFPIFVNPMERDTEPQLVFASEQFLVISCYREGMGACNIQFGPSLKSLRAMTIDRFTCYHWAVRLTVDIALRLMVVLILMSKNKPGHPF